MARLLVQWVAVLLASLAVATVQGATYVEYQLYSASDCNANSLVSKGIYAAENTCISTAGSSSQSRRFTCQNVISYKLSSSCEDVEIPEIPENLKTTTEALDACRATGNSENQYIKFACQSGYYARILESNAPNCTFRESESIREDSFFLFDTCTNTISPRQVVPELIERSSMTVRRNSTTFEVREWSTRNCNGSSVVATNYTIGCYSLTEENLRVVFMDAPSSSIVVRLGSMGAAFLAAAIVFVSM